MKTILSILLAVFCTATAQAKSDTNVRILEAKRIEIRDDHVIIVGRATTHTRVVDSEAPGDFLGRSSTWVEIYSSDATFIVRKPQLNWNGPEGEEKARFERMIEEAWQMTIEAAKDLKAGKEVDRIGYDQPTISIDRSMIVKIEGNGFLYPKRKMEDAEQTTEADR